jgi:hypothetical protein
MHMNQAKVAWNNLRSTRWSPPGAAAATEERQETYQAALEQAEEMFTAAAQVSPVARPVPVFYGLSQGGRAIAAAASKAAGEDWKLNGHGIRAHDFGKPLPEMILKTDKAGDRGSFVRLSELLGSTVWGNQAVKFTELWDLIPENSPDLLALSEDHKSRRTPLLVDPVDIGQPHPIASAVLYGFPSWLLEVPEPNLTMAVDGYLDAFPAAVDRQGYVLQHTGRVPNLQRGGDGWGFLQVNWNMPEGAHGADNERAAYLRSLARRYKEAHYLLPDLSTGSVHPLMAWWGVLYGLSMLARYEPAAWTRQININKSRYANPLEKLLDAALDVVPHLIMEAIEEVS